MTDKLREAAQMALEALELVDGYVMGKHEAKEALYEALAQPEPETAGYLTNAFGNEWVFTTKKINQHSQPLYTAQPQREWQGLTEEEIEELNCTTINASDWNEYEVYKPSVQEFARAIEAKLKEKNT